MRDYQREVWLFCLRLFWCLAPMPLAPDSTHYSIKSRGFTRNYFSSGIKSRALCPVAVSSPLARSRASSRRSAGDNTHNTLLEAILLGMKGARENENQDSTKRRGFLEGSLVHGNRTTIVSKDRHNSNSAHCADDALSQHSQHSKAGHLLSVINTFTIDSYYFYFTKKVLSTVNIVYTKYYYVFNRESNHLDSQHGVDSSQ